jgi:uronate dehydrogenase
MSLRLGQPPIFGKEHALKTILMTGAAGRVGTFLRPELAGKYKLRLSDIKTIRDLRRGETFVRADISKFSDALRITKGVDAVVHLGGQSGENDWEHILSANIVGFYNVLEAARRNGVKRFLVATSNHAVGFYRCDQTIDHRVYPKPDSRYGVSKVFNEALASLYADRYGMELFCMRIGNVNHVPIDRRRLAIWISGRDMAQLVTIGLEHPKLHFEVVYGISDNRRAWYDNSNAHRLGYRPQDRSEPYASEILKREGVPGKSIADIHQGGGHCVAEGGTRSRLADAPAARDRTVRTASRSKVRAAKASPGKGRKS